MIKKKSRIKIVIVFMTFFIIISTLITLKNLLPPIQFFIGDYPHYTDAASIMKAADVVIVGDVINAGEVKELMVDVTPDKTDKETTPYTLSTIKVTEIIKGNIKIGDILTIKQLGDYKNKPEKTLYEMDGYVKKDEKELMFLCEYTDSPYSPVNPAQGIIKINADGTLFSSNKYSLWGYKETGEEIQSTKEIDKIDSVIDKLKSYSIVTSKQPDEFLQSDFQYYKNAVDIKNAADVIIVGDIINAGEVKELMVDVTPDKTDKETTPYTLSTIKVTETIKGNIKIGDILTIKQLGDYKNKPEKTLYEMDGYVKKDEKELMFLCEYADSPYSPVNPAQGIIKINADGTLFSSNKYSLWGYKEAEDLESVITILNSY